MHGLEGTYKGSTLLMQTIDVQKTQTEAWVSKLTAGALEKRSFGETWGTNVEGWEILGQLASLRVHKPVLLSAHSTSVCSRENPVN